MRAEVLQFKRERTFEEKECERLFLQYIGAISFELRSVIERQHIMNVMAPEEMRDSFDEVVKEFMTLRKRIMESAVEIDEWSDVLARLSDMYTIIDLETLPSDDNLSQIVQSHVERMNEVLTSALQLLEQIDAQ